MNVYLMVIIIAFNFLEILKSCFQAKPWIVPSLFSQFIGLCIRVLCIDSFTRERERKSTNVPLQQRMKIL